MLHRMLKNDWREAGLTRPKWINFRKSSTPEGRRSKISITNFPLLWGYIWHVQTLTGPQDSVLFLSKDGERAKAIRNFSKNPPIQRKWSSAMMRSLIHGNICNIFWYFKICHYVFQYIITFCNILLYFVMQRKCVKKLTCKAGKRKDKHGLLTFSRKFKPDRGRGFQTVIWGWLWSRVLLIHKPIMLKTLSIHKPIMLKTWKVQIIINLAPSCRHMLS